jgi:hypothetical protein
MSKVISLNKFIQFKNIQKQLDMASIADELIQDAYKRGVCEHCGNFMDNPHHTEPCKLKKEEK